MYLNIYGPVHNNNNSYQPPKLHPINYKNKFIFSNIIIKNEEIKDVVDDMEDDKAPGPDGFNVNFIKVCSRIVQK